MNLSKPPSCPSTFCFFWFSTLYYWHKSSLYNVLPLSAWHFDFVKKTKVHRLIFNTYHTNGFNIPDLQPNYEYQHGMQQHLKLNVITLIQLYINTTRTLKYPKPSLNLLFVAGKVCFSGYSSKRTPKPPTLPPRLPLNHKILQ